MRKSTLSLACLAAVLLASLPALAQTPVGTAFTYQGQLKDAGVPVNTDSASFQFALYDAAIGGNQIGSTVSVGHVTVANGLFTVLLDFGSAAFSSDARWLAVSVFKNGVGWVILTPRQRITPTPAALFSTTAAQLVLPYDQAGISDDTLFALHNSGAEGSTTLLAEHTGPEATALRAVVSGSDSIGLLASSSGQYGTGVYATAAASGYAGYFYGRGYFSGNLGLGMTNPATRLDVAGGNYDLIGTEGDVRIGSDAYRLKIGIATSGGSAGLARLRAYGIAGTPKLALGAGSFDMLTVTTSNVGVGTLSPAGDAKLDVNGRLKATGFQLGSTATAGYVLTCDATGLGTWQAPTGGGESLWQPGTGGDIYYGGGRVGIGTSTLDADLHVATNSAVRGIHVTGAVNGLIAEGSQTAVRGEGGNYGVYGAGTSYGVRGYCAGNGRGLEAESVSGVGARVTGGGSGTTWPALHILSTNAAGIGIYSVSTSTDANIVAANKGTGDIIKGFSGSTGGDLVFRVENNGKTHVSVLQITGGADLSEQFDITPTATAPQPGMVVCIDPAHPGQLIVSTKAYDRTVAGVLSGAGGVRTGMLMGQQGTPADGQHPVALTGRVYVLADATMQAVEPGDLLTTSAVPGHAMKAADAAQSPGATLGKAMTRLERGQRGLVLVLVNLQ